MRAAGQGRHADSKDAMTVVTDRDYSLQVALAPARTAMDLAAFNGTAVVPWNSTSGSDNSTLGFDNSTLSYNNSTGTPDNSTWSTASNVRPTTGDTPLDTAGDTNSSDADSLAPQSAPSAGADALGALIQVWLRVLFCEGSQTRNDALD